MVIDLAKKFVRVTELRSDGFVEFDFSIGEPGLFVEMILPATAFDEFCAVNEVAFLDASSRLKVGGEDNSEWEWTLHDATHQRFKSGPS